jgi:hypothetical protein
MTTSTRSTVLALTLALAGCGANGIPGSGSGNGSGNGGSGQSTPDLGLAARCGRATADPGSSDPLARLQYAMVGSWQGSASSPWVAPWSVAIDFTADGNYDATTTDSSAVGWAVPPFYYDQDPEHDRWQLTTLDGSDGAGAIYLQWLDTPDDMKAICFNDALTHLHFEYYHLGYGPVVYELDCHE